MSSRALPIVLALLLVLPLAPARATAPLGVDAGGSQVAYDGASLAVSGVAIGGSPPYTFAWSAPAGSFADASAASTSFATAGSPVGAIVLTLTVTDSLGAVATDTVRQYVERARLLRDVSVALPAGAPDELVGGTSPDRKSVSFSVPPGTARVILTLSWPDPQSDIQLDVERAAAPGTPVASSRSASPETITLEQPSSGGWSAHVRPILTTGTTAHLRVQAFPAAALPVATVDAPAKVGTLDTPTLRASATGGASPYAFAWDADGDGWFESPGANITLPPSPTGIQAPRLKTTDAAGFEAVATFPITVVDAHRALRFVCGGDISTPYWAMEFRASHDTCWIHGGHHTYFTGAERFAFRGAEGYAFAVEQQFAWPLEPSADVNGSQMHVEVSDDSRAWTEVGTGRYILMDGVSIPQRQVVTFDIDGTGDAFRWLRVRSPLSASQGLSGYLDHTDLRVFVDELGAAPQPALEQGTRAFSCDARDNMEDFFETHPCWFGGIDRYDAASFFETYYVGEGATLDSATGTFTLMPFRDDDWFVGNSTANASAVHAYVHTSVDGVEWTLHDTIPATFGIPQPFDVELGGTAARFVRLFPEYHARFDDASSPPLHHPKGYFVHTAVTVEGLLPEA